MKIFFATIAFTSQVSWAAGPIENPQLIFEFGGPFSKLETCIVEKTIEGAPFIIAKLQPSGSVVYAETSAGEPIKNLLDVLAVGYSGDGLPTGYSLRFATFDGSEWIYFQRDRIIGAYASNMRPMVEVLSHKTKDVLFKVDIEACQNL